MLSTPYFVTVDAETEVICEGVQTISEIRQEIEEEMGIKIPIVWFVRFQRGWTESVKNDSVEYFEGPLTRFYDGFELATSQFLALQERGDEIAWHYHAYNYVHRCDLAHETRMAILRADLIRCAREMRTRHPYFNIQSFRFGWFFIPDYAIYQTLKEIGLKADASIHPEKRGKVANSVADYLPPLVTKIKEIDGMWLFPKMKTFLIHDWNVVPHQLGWTSQNEQSAQLMRTEFMETLSRTVAEGKRNRQHFTTYRDCS